MIKLKPERISNFADYTDAEILSGAIYCKKLVDRKEEIYKDEFFAICFFLFDGDEKETVKTLEFMIEKYLDEYSERRKN